MVLTPLQTDLSALAEGVNMMWVLVVTFLIFFMHAGFAMLESGQVRSKNVANQLTKNLLTWAVGVVAFFFVGAAVDALASAVSTGNSFTLSGLYSSSVGGGSSEWVDWLFGAVFAMTAATIVSGAVAGRAKLRAYVTYTLALAAVIYPVISGLSWGTGWLVTEIGFHDFAGGMVVHGLGGIAGLTAAWVLGPRIDRYNEDGSVNVIPGHSMTFAVLGTLILAFGWYGFNVGTAATVVTSDGTSLGAFSSVGRVALATTLGMAFGALGSAAVSLAMTDKVDTLYVANGVLAGLVGVTGIADIVTWPGAAIIAFIAGAQLPIVFRLVERHLKIDDVCAVFPVHGSAGVAGALLIPLFTVEGTSVAGGLLSIDAGQFVPQIVGVLVISVWAILATGAIWGAFRAIGQARVTPEHERDGLDISEHGVDTYPEFGSELAADGGASAGPANAVPEQQLRSDGGDDAYATDIEMVVAYVRPDRLSDVKRSLAESGAPSLTVTNVSGRGSQPAKTGQWRGDEYVVDLHQKVKIECVVADTPTEDVVEAIREGAHTGEPGDGKVFVVPVTSALQVRTGKTGPDAV